MAAENEQEQEQGIDNAPIDEGQRARQFKNTLRLSRQAEEEETAGAAAAAAAVPASTEAPELPLAETAIQAQASETNKLSSQTGAAVLERIINKAQNMKGLATGLRFYLLRYRKDIPANDRQEFYNLLNEFSHEYQEDPSLVDLDFTDPKLRETWETKVQPVMEQLLPEEYTQIRKKVLLLCKKEYEVNGRRDEKEDETGSFASSAAKVVAVGTAAAIGLKAAQDALDRSMPTTGASSEQAAATTETRGTAEAETTASSAMVASEQARGIPETAASPATQTKAGISSQTTRAMDLSGLSVQPAFMPGGLLEQGDEIATEQDKARELRRSQVMSKALTMRGVLSNAQQPGVENAATGPETMGALSYAHRQAGISGRVLARATAAYKQGGVAGMANYFQSRRETPEQEGGYTMETIDEEPELGQESKAGMISGGSGFRSVRPASSTGTMSTQADLGFSGGDTIDQLNSIEEPQDLTQASDMQGGVSQSAARRALRRSKASTLRQAPGTVSPEEIEFGVVSPEQYTSVAAPPRRSSRRAVRRNVLASDRSRNFQQFDRPDDPGLGLGERSQSLPGTQDEEFLLGQPDVSPSGVMPATFAGAGAGFGPGSIGAPLPFGAGYGAGAEQGEEGMYDDEDSEEDTEAGRGRALRRAQKEDKEAKAKVDVVANVAAEAQQVEMLLKQAKNLKNLYTAIGGLLSFSGWGLLWTFIQWHLQAIVSIFGPKGDGIVGPKITDTFGLPWWGWPLLLLVDLLLFVVMLIVLMGAWIIVDPCGAWEFFKSVGIADIIDNASITTWLIGKTFSAYCTITGKLEGIL